MYISVCFLIILNVSHNRCTSILYFKCHLQNLLIITLKGTLIVNYLINNPFNFATMDLHMLPILYLKHIVLYIQFLSQILFNVL